MKNINNYITEKLKLNQQSKRIKLPEIQDAFEYAIEVADKLVKANDKYKVLDKCTKLTTTTLDKNNLIYAVEFETSKEYFKEPKLMKEFGEAVLKEVKKKYRTDTHLIEVHAYDDTVTLIIDWDLILPDKEDEVTEKLHLGKGMMNDDQRYILRWTDLLEKHYADWAHEYDNRRNRNIYYTKSSDETIEKEMNGLIKWLKDHYRKVELWNFENSKLPADFIRYLRQNKLLKNEED